MQSPDDEVIERWDIGHQTALVKNSRAKPIEGIFNHIQRKLFDLTNGVGFHQRNDGDVADMQAKALERAKANGGLLTHTQFFSKVMDAVTWWNHHKFNVNDARNGFSPDELFNRSIAQSGVVRMSEQALMMAVMPFDMKMIRNSMVRVNRKDYVSAALLQYSGNNKKYKVYHDPLNVDWVYVEVDRKIIACELYLDINAKDYKKVSQAIGEQRAVLRSIMNERKRIALSYQGEIKVVNKISHLDMTAKQVSSAKSAKDELKQVMGNDDLTLRMYSEMQAKKAMGA